MEECVIPSLPGTAQVKLWRNRMLSWRALSPSFNSEGNREQQEMQPCIIFFLSEMVLTTWMEKVRGSRIESLFPSILWSRSEERISFSLMSLHFQIIVLTSTWIAPGVPAAWVIAHSCAEVQSAEILERDICVVVINLSMNSGISADPDITLFCESLS